MTNGDVYVACSDCFKDFGLRATAQKFGHETSQPCKNCRSLAGRKLTMNTLEEVCFQFFQLGTGFKGRGWLATQIAFNTTTRDYDPFGATALRDDLLLLHSAFGINCFFYGPPLWMFGKPVDEDGEQRWETQDYEYICDSCSKVTLTETDIFFRVQCNLDGVFPDNRFCSPPDKFRRTFGRFDSAELPILYAAYDIETCLHESRITVRDEIYLATLRPVEPIRLLDLSSCKARVPITAFEDPNVWLTCLLFDSESYENCQELSRYIKSLGYHGFVSKSYFQQVSEREHKNISIFGRPIVESLLRVDCVNRIVPQNVTYDYCLGPAISKADSEP